MLRAILGTAGVGTCAYGLFSYCKKQREIKIDHDRKEVIANFLRELFPDSIELRVLEQSNDYSLLLLDALEAATPFRRGKVKKPTIDEVLDRLKTVLTTQKLDSDLINSLITQLKTSVEYHKHSAPCMEIKDKDLIIKLYLTAIRHPAVTQKLRS